MSSSSITTSDGEVVVTRSDDGLSAPSAPPTPPVAGNGTVHSGSGTFTVGVHSDKPLDAPSLIAGLVLGMLLCFILQSALRWHGRREVKAQARAAAIGPQGEDRIAAEVAALARRTATLETIVTDPAHRTAREIEALR